MKCVGLDVPTSKSYVLYAWKHLVLPKPTFLAASEWYFGSQGAERGAGDAGTRAVAHAKAQLFDGQPRFRAIPRMCTAYVLARVQV